MSQFIGKTISLISNSDIRYLGVLHEINSEESTVSLMKVRTFGTEGRTGGVNEIPASDAVYDYVVFRGSDVKDLKIADESELEPQQQDVVQQAQPEQVTPTPAPAPAPQAQVPPAASAPAPASEEAPRKARPEPRREPKEGRDFQRPQRQHQPREHQPRERESREREPREQAAQIAPTGQSDQPFDFSSSSIEDFKKEQAAETDEKFYNKKSSFFDNISHSTRDQQRDPEQNRVNRELNMETFGQTESGFRNNNFRGGRGRGRGGRGRGGRGRGRGDGLSNRDRETFGGW